MEETYHFESFKNIKLASYPGRGRVIGVIMVTFLVSCLVFYMGYTIRYQNGASIAWVVGGGIFSVGFYSLFHDLNMYDWAVFEPDRIYRLTKRGKEVPVCSEDEIMALILHKYEREDYRGMIQGYHREYFLTIKIYLNTRRTVTLKHLIFTENGRYVDHWRNNVRKFCKKYYRIYPTLTNHHYRNGRARKWWLEED